MSAFERAGVAYVAGSRRSLKIIIEGKAYYIHVNDIGRALADANFKTYIHKLSDTFTEQPQENAWPINKSFQKWNKMFRE